MRTSFVDRRFFPVLLAILLWINIMPDSNLMADSPTFSISNSFDRSEDYLLGDWSTVDTYSQDYSLTWGEVYSSRLKVDFRAKVKLEDIIRSLDIDEKTVTPSLDLNLSSFIWDLDIQVEDKIEYTNELNIPRRDEVEFGLDLNVAPFYFPPLEVILFIP